MTLQRDQRSDLDHERAHDRVLPRRVVDQRVDEQPKQCCAQAERVGIQLAAAPEQGREPGLAHRRQEPEQHRQRAEAPLGSDR